MNVVIRLAAPADAAELLNIYSFYVKNTAVSFECEVPTLKDFTIRIENTLKKYPYLVAENDGNIVGYAYASAFRSRSAYKFSAEVSVYIDPGCRRAGIGKLLYTKLEELLYAQRVTNLYACIAYTERNDEYLTDASVHFHEHMGYRLVGKLTGCGYKFGNRYDILYMEKFCYPEITSTEEFIPFPELGIRKYGEEN